MNENKLTPEAIAFRKELYWKTREECASFIRSNNETYDRSILSLSSIFLGGSAPFVNSFFKLSDSSYYILFILALISFVLTIILLMIAYQRGQAGLQSLKEKAFGFYIEGKDELFHDSERETKSAGFWSELYGATFVIGLFLLTTFVTLNLSFSKAT